MNRYGSYELFFTYHPEDDRILDVHTNILGVAMYDAAIVPTEIMMRFASYQQSGITFIKVHTFIDATERDASDFTMSVPSIDYFHIRLYFNKEYISVYCNGKAVYLYAVSEIDYPDVVLTSMVSVGNGIVVTDLRCPEIPDVREAVYVDYETTSDSAIQSIIQQRPVQIFPGDNRELCFTYDAIGDTLTPPFIRGYQESVRPSSGISSDGLVYYSDVAISISLDTAEEVGLVTKLYRLSELDAGAVQATATFQKLALERRKPITVICRYDPRIQITDRLLIDLIASGTQRHIDESVIVEDVQMTIENSIFTAQITARKETV